MICPSQKDEEMCSKTSKRSESGSWPPATANLDRTSDFAMVVALPQDMDIEAQPLGDTRFKSSKSGRLSS